ARITSTDYAGHVTVSLGPLNAGFDGRITLSELAPPLSYRISAEARGSIAGSAAGSARVRLTDIAGGSILHYEAQTEIGGRLATIGAKFVRGTATRFADKFFSRFAKAMEERAMAAAIPVNGSSMSTRSSSPGLTQGSTSETSPVVDMDGRVKPGH